MDEIIIYSTVAIGLLVIIIFLYIFQKKAPQRLAEPEQEQDENRTSVEATPPRVLQPNEALAGRNRAVANRNARARMRVAQAQAAQRQQQDQDSDNSDSDSEMAEPITLPEGKIGKKKLAKLQAKADKKAMREAEEREREEKKKREEELLEKKRRDEAKWEEEEQQREEEEKKRQEEEERKEQEEYEKMKVQFEVEEEGFDKEENEGNTKNMLEDFVEYIKKSKVVVMEDVAAKYKMKTQAVIDRITTLQRNSTLTGLIDDRGKFIYVTPSEIQAVVTFVRQRGRVTLSDIAEASNTLIRLTPEEGVGG